MNMSPLGRNASSSDILHACKANLQQLIMSFVLIDWHIRSSPLRCLVGSRCSIFIFLLWKGSLNSVLSTIVSLLVPFLFGHSYVFFFDLRLLLTTVLFPRNNNIAFFWYLSQTRTLIITAFSVVPVWIYDRVVVPGLIYDRVVVPGLIYYRVVVPGLIYE